MNTQIDVTDKKQQTFNNLMKINNINLVADAIMTACDELNCTIDELLPLTREVIKARMLEGKEDDSR